MFDWAAFRKAFNDRLKYGDTCRSLGEQIGVSTSTVHRFKSGAKLDLESAMRVAKFLGVQLEDFAKD